MLQKDGEETNLANADRVYIYEDNDGKKHAKVVKLPTTYNGNPSLSKGETIEGWEERKKLYYSSEVKAVGIWLRGNYQELSEEQQERLIKIGYLTGNKRIAKKARYSAAKDEFNNDSTFTEVSKKIVAGTKSDISTLPIPSPVRKSGGQK